MTLAMHAFLHDKFIQLYGNLSTPVNHRGLILISMKRDNIIATQGLTSLIDGQPDIDLTEKKVELIKTKLREFFNLKNVNFLFGAGTSSGAIDAMSNLSELI